MGMRVPADVERKALELAGAPAPRQSEADFMADVLAFARGQGWLAYHTHDSRKSAPGFPDAVFARGRRLIVAELKAVGGRVTLEQGEWLAAFRSAGIPAYCWVPDSWPEIERVLRG